MKNTIALIGTAILAVTNLNAQISRSMEAFSHIGVGLEAGLMGAGIEISMPVVTNHMVLKVGYNFPVCTYPTDIDFSASDINNEINKLNQNISTANATLGRSYSPVSNLNDKVVVDVDGKIDFTAVKTLVELYPSKRSKFHFVFGAYIGNESLISLSGIADDATRAAYKSAVKLEKEYKANGDDKIFGDIDIKNSIKYNIDETSYGLGEDCVVDATVKVLKVRPYFGLGWGRSIPSRRVGFQFEVGAWYHGKPTIESPNELPVYDSSADGIDGIGETMERVLFWPQMTFRITGRLF